MMRLQLILLLLLLSAPAYSQTASPPAGQSPNTVKGDVMYWEGEELVVKDILGKEYRLHVNGETKIEGTAGRLKTGDKIEAVMTAEGHATSIRLQIPDAAPAPQGSPLR